MTDDGRLSLEVALHEANARLDELADVLERAFDDAARPARDMRALVDWAERRIDVHARLATLEQGAVTAIQQAAHIDDAPAGLATLDALEQLDCDAASAVRERIVGLRKLTSALNDADRRRFALVAKCREIIHGYLSAVNPPTLAYGRQGERTAAEVPASTRSSA